MIEVENIFLRRLRIKNSNKKFGSDGIAITLKVVSCVLKLNIIINYRKLQSTKHLLYLCLCVYWTFYDFIMDCINKFMFNLKDYFVLKSYIMHVTYIKTTHKHKTHVPISTWCNNRLGIKCLIYFYLKRDKTFSNQSIRNIVAH